MDGTGAHPGLGSRREGRITAQPPTVPGTVRMGYRGHGVFLYLEHHFRRVFGEIWDFTFDVVSLELYLSLVNWEDVCSVEIRGEKQNHVILGI